MAWLACREIFSFDPRGLALYRVLLALVIYYVLYDHYRGADAFLSETGVYKYFRGLPASIYKICGAVSWARLLIVIHALLNTSFLLGYRTRLSTFATYFMYVQVYNRAPYVRFGADSVLLFCLFWAQWTHLGRRFSVDAFLARAEELEDEDDKNKKSIFTCPDLEFTPGTVGHVLNWSTMYLIAGIAKYGPSWTVTGRAVSVTLLNDWYAGGALARLVVQYRELCRLLTLGTLYLEIGGVFAALSPIFFTPLRLLALLSFQGLQLSFFTLMYVDWFPFACSISQIPLLPTGFWNFIFWTLDTKYRKSYVVKYDPRSEQARQVAAFLETFILHPSTRVVASRDKPFKGTWGVQELKSKDGKPLDDKIGAVLRLTPWITLPLRPFVPLVTRLWSLCSAIVVPNLTVPAAAETDSKKSRWRTCKQVSSWLFAAFWFWLIICANHDGMQGYHTDTNNFCPTYLVPLFRDIWTVAGQNQFFALFAPEPPRDDGWFVLDARLKNGSHTDLALNLKEEDFNSIFPPALGVKPNFGFPKFAPTGRWFAHFGYGRMPQFKRSVCGASEFLCLKWNKAQKNWTSEVAEIHWWFHHEPTDPETLEEGPISRAAWWHHVCPPSRMRVRPFTKCEHEHPDLTLAMVSGMGLGGSGTEDTKNSLQYALKLLSSLGQSAKSLASSSSLGEIPKKFGISAEVPKGVMDENGTLALAFFTEVFPDNTNCTVGETDCCPNGRIQEECPREAEVCGMLNCTIPVKCKADPCNRCHLVLHDNQGNLISRHDHCKWKPAPCGDMPPCPMRDPVCGPKPKNCGPEVVCVFDPCSCASLWVDEPLMWKASCLSAHWMPVDRVPGATVPPRTPSGELLFMGGVRDFAPPPLWAELQLSAAGIDPNDLGTLLGGGVGVGAMPVGHVGAMPVGNMGAAMPAGMAGMAAAGTSATIAALPLGSSLHDAPKQYTAPKPKL